MLVRPREGNSLTEVLTEEIGEFPIRMIVLII
jgi:hypothetical protein